MAPEAPTVGTTESGLVYQWTAPAIRPHDQVEQGESERAHAVLDVVAEDPQRPHVADDVRPAAVEEHAGQERPVVVDRESDPRGPSRVAVAGRHDARGDRRAGRAPPRAGSARRRRRGRSARSARRRPAADCGWGRCPGSVSSLTAHRVVGIEASGDRPARQLGRRTGPTAFRAGSAARVPIEAAQPRVTRQRLPVHALEGGFDQEDLDVAQGLMRRPDRP